jgi:hypothetical protein
MEFSEQEKREISGKLYEGLEDMCEEYIKHVTEVGGVSRFNIKSVLLQAAWHGYKIALDSQLKGK